MLIPNRRLRAEEVPKPRDAAAPDSPSAPRLFFFGEKNKFKIYYKKIYLKYTIKNKFKIYYKKINLKYTIKNKFKIYYKKYHPTLTHTHRHTHIF